MRLAVIADIHGNLPALEAVLADLRRRGTDRVVNLGDCVSGPLWPRETMDLLDTLGLPTVRGNHDRWVAETPRERMHASDAFAHDRLTRSAAPRRSVHCPLGSISATASLPCTAQPRDDNEYLLDDVVDGGLALARPQRIAERLGEMRATVLLCAHTHQARIVRGPRDMLIANPGSVGCPGYVDPTPPAHVSEAGSPHARYAMLTRASERWSVDLIAIEYDWTSASKRAAENGRPEWAQALATGYRPLTTSFSALRLAGDTVNVRVAARAEAGLNIARRPGPRKLGRRGNARLRWPEPVRIDSDASSVLTHRFARRAQCLVLPGGFR